MSKFVNYIFAASFSSLEAPLPQPLCRKFTGTTIPRAYVVDPFKVAAQYDAVDFYSNQPLTLDKRAPSGYFSAFKNSWGAGHFEAQAKQSKSGGERNFSRKKRSAPPKLARRKHDIVRYELRPRLPFVLEHRLWYPVEQAWQIYNYDKSYLSSVQIERLEALHKERNDALEMMRGGHFSYWRLVRDAEIGMFGDSPEFGSRPKSGRKTPLVGRGISELFSYKVRRGKSARFRAADGFQIKGPQLETSVGSRAQENKPAFSPRVHGQALECIAEEDIPEPPARKSVRPLGCTQSVQDKITVSSKSACLPAVQSLVNAMPEPWNTTLESLNTKRRQSIDSGFAESRSMSSSEAPSAPSPPNASDSMAAEAPAPALDDIADPFRQEYCATVSQTHQSYSFPLYEENLSRVQSAVDKASGIRQCSIDSLKRVCRARRMKSAAVILTPDIQEEEGVPLFKPWTIGEQSISTYRNPRKWVSIVKDKVRGVTM
ncbi:unnamed protein product [Tuber aestivum]|uniref:Uncharacterized protein n=1 Tax=Tuber aestivum TaxID=59557 RepID=A0A292PLE4_9PEZI|nr:unnamed protein product [Tuber aestivum]